MLSDGDLIVQIGIAKGEYLIYSNDSSIYFKSFIARINKETGQIIWAYAYFFNEFENQQIPYSLKVINDTIWTIGYFENSGSYPVGITGVVLKYNAEGDLEYSVIIASGKLSSLLDCISALFFANNSFVTL